MSTPLMTRILLATDFSDAAACAQDYARYLARAWNATVELVHVIETPQWLGADAEALAVVGQARAAAALQLEGVRDDLVGGGIPVKVRLVLGNPTEQICQAVRESGVDLVVLGVQGRNNLAYGLLGSTAERVAHEGPCPVLLVPAIREAAAQPVGEGGAGRVRRILAPLDFSRLSLDAVEYATHLAFGLGSTLTLMHVLEPVCYDLDCGLGLIEEEASKRDYWNRQLTELREILTASGLSVDLEISSGLVSDAILASALRSKADLIVMGTHGHRGPSRERFGSMADAVLRRATCPVLTVSAFKPSSGLHRVVPQTMGAVGMGGTEPRHL